MSPCVSCQGLDLRVPVWFASTACPGTEGTYLPGVLVRSGHPLHMLLEFTRQFLWVMRGVGWRKDYECLYHLPDTKPETVRPSQKAVPGPGVRSASEMHTTIAFPCPRLSRSHIGSAGFLWNDVRLPPISSTTLQTRNQRVSLKTQMLWGGAPHQLLRARHCPVPLM